MRNIKQKFIITDKGFKMGRVVFHKELNYYDDEVVGGGSWYWDQENDTLYLYGESHDFGGVTMKHIMDNLKNIKKRYFKNSDVIFCGEPYKTLLEILSEKMDESKAKALIAQNDFLC